MVSLSNSDDSESSFEFLEDTLSDSDAPPTQPWHSRITKSQRSVFLRKLLPEHVKNINESFRKAAELEEGFFRKSERIEDYLRKVFDGYHMVNGYPGIWEDRLEKLPVELTTGSSSADNMDIEELTYRICRFLDPRVRPLMMTNSNVEVVNEEMIGKTEPIAEELEKLGRKLEEKMEQVEAELGAGSESEPLINDSAPSQQEIDILKAKIEQLETQLQGKPILDQICGIWHLRKPIKKTSSIYLTITKTDDTRRQFWITKLNLRGKLKDQEGIDFEGKCNPRNYIENNQWITEEKENDVLVRRRVITVKDGSLMVEIIPKNEQRYVEVYTMIDEVPAQPFYWRIWDWIQEKYDEYSFRLFVTAIIVFCLLLMIIVPLVLLYGGYLGVNLYCDWRNSPPPCSCPSIFPTSFPTSSSELLEKATRIGNSIAANAPASVSEASKTISKYFSLSHD